MTQLPSNQMPVQADFLSHYDGTIKSIISFDRLHQLLNICLGAHYFFVSGTHDGDTVSTKSTDGSWAYWGDHTQEQRDNAYIMLIAIKKELIGNGAYLIGNKYYINIDGVPTRIKGLTNANIL